MTSRQHDDQSGFMDALDGIRRLHSDKVDLYAQRQRPPARVRNEAQPTAQQHNPFPAALTAQAVDAAYFHHGLSKKLQRRIRAGKLPINDIIDLHGHHQRQAHVLLSHFLQDALASGYRLVLIIHGKGFRSADEARLRPLTQRLLASHPDVLAYCPAIDPDGGSGASYAYLRRKT